MYSELICILSDAIFEEAFCKVCDFIIILLSDIILAPFKLLKLELAFISIFPKLNIFALFDILFAISFALFLAWIRFEFIISSLAFIARLFAIISPSC